LGDPLRLLCVLAHPDDESLGCGGTLAKYSAEGVETFLVTATRGERGRIGGERPGPEVAGPIRERELRCAAAELGVRNVHLLDYVDAELAQADAREASAKIAAHVRAIRPQVVVTFAADGCYGHPDHIAISQLTGAALMAAADPQFMAPGGIDLPPAAHRVAKFYWMAWSAELFAAYEEAIGSRLTARVDDVERRAVPWPDWALTAQVDARPHWRTVWRAVKCHRSQISNYGGLVALAEAQHEEIWGRQTFYRVWSLANGGQRAEDDLFAGLR